MGSTWKPSLSPGPISAGDGQLLVCLRHLWPRGLSSPMSVHVLFCIRQLTGLLPGVEPWASPVWWVLWGFPHPLGGWQGGGGRPGEHSMGPWEKVGALMSEQVQPPQFVCMGNTHQPSAGTSKSVIVWHDDD